MWNTESTGCFPNDDWFCHPCMASLWEDNTKKVAKDDKTNHGRENTLLHMHVCL